MTRITAGTIAVAALLAAGTGLQRTRNRRPTNPFRAPGHTHPRPVPSVQKQPLLATRREHYQPWIRTNHSDSQQRRFRR